MIRIIYYRYINPRLHAPSPGLSTICIYSYTHNMLVNVGNPYKNNKFYNKRLPTQDPGISTLENQATSPKDPTWAHLLGRLNHCTTAGTKV